MHGYLKADGRLIIGEVTGNKDSVKFTHGDVVYLNQRAVQDATTTSKIARNWGIKLNPNGNMSIFIERMEPIPEGGLTFPRDDSYTPLDRLQYEVIYGILKNW